MYKLNDKMEVILIKEVLILVLSLYNLQTEFIFVRELRPANITVESRLFKSDSDEPVTSVPDFFVSYNIS